MQIPGQDSVSFLMSKWQPNPLEKMTEVKNLALGENDLHLETPGHWEKTLYPDVYEIPESFLIILSLVIRLANEKDKVTQDNASMSLSWKEFLDRARALEKCIVSWKPITDQNADGGSALDSGEGSHYFVSNMLGALQQALLIFFHRRIYNVDASVLQRQVELVRDKLCDHQQEDVVPVKYTAAFVWPVFIAACEAVDEDLQISFRTWFEARANFSGLQMYMTVLQVVKQVWRQRRETGDSSISWPEVLRQQNCRLFFC